MTYERFEDLPVWQEAIRLAEGCKDFLYIARGSAGETRSMLCYFERRPGLRDFKSQISNFRSLWRDHNVDDQRIVSCRRREARAWHERLPAPGGSCEACMCFADHHHQVGARIERNQRRRRRRASRRSPAATSPAVPASGTTAR